MAWQVNTSSHDWHNPRFSFTRPEGYDRECRKASDFHRLGANLGPSEGRDLPTQLRLDKPRRTIPDVLQMFGTWMVAERFRQIVEELEPGVHQFFPIEAIRRDGTPAGAYHILNLCNSLDFLAEDQSWLTWHRAVNGRWSPSYGLGDDWLVARPEVIAGRHMWWGGDLLSNVCFFSDDLKRAMGKERLKGWIFNHVLEGERPEGGRPQNALGRPPLRREAEATYEAKRGRQMTRGRRSRFPNRGKSGTAGKQMRTSLQGAT